MSISIQIVAQDQVLEATLYTSTSALQIVDRLPLEVELEAAPEGLCARFARPLGTWLERGDRAPLPAGELVLRPGADERLCILRAPLGLEQALRVNPLGRLRGDVAALERLRGGKALLRQTQGPGHSERASSRELATPA